MSEESELRLIEEIVYSAQLHDVIDNLADKVIAAAGLLKQLGLHKDGPQVVISKTQEERVQRVAWLVRANGLSMQEFDDLIQLADDLAIPEDEPAAQDDIKPYGPPQITAEMNLETRAGSPICPPLEFPLPQSELDRGCK